MAPATMPARECFQPSAAAEPTRTGAAVVRVTETES
jgi:hypothetical protein